MNSPPVSREAPDPAFALRIAAFYARSPNAAYTNAALGLIAVGVMWGHAPITLLLGWFVCVLAINIASLALHRYSARGNALPRDPARWAAISTWWMLASGIVWGGGAAALFPLDDPLRQAFWLVLANGIAAGVVAANAFHRPAQVAYLLPLLLPLIVSMALAGGSERYAIAAGMALYLAFCLMQGRDQARLVKDTVDMRFENERLVAALREQTREANVARARAEEATRDKARFFAAASHDLRQPLHALGLFNAALAQTRPRHDQRELIGHMDAGINALEDLLHALLDISRLDAGAISVAARAVRLSELVDGAAYETSAAAKGLRFVVTGGGSAWVRADPVLIQRVLGNLLSNAIRYTDNGSVVVAFRRCASGRRIEVRDSGIGIAESEHSNIFNEFYQLNNPGRERRAGVGLATAQRLAALSGTQITLRSAPRRGAVFAFTLPLASAHDTPPVVASAADADLLDGALVAVIDDEPMVREGLAALLTRWSAQPVCAAGSAALLDALNERTPAVLISDWMLAGEDGIGAVDAVRRVFPHVPAILATADSSPERRAAAQARNLTLMVKPFQPARLRAALNAALAMRSRNRT